MKLKHIIAGLFWFFPLSIFCSQLVKLSVVDEEYIMLHFKDAEVQFVDDGKGEKAFMHHTHDSTNNFMVTYGEPLNIKALSHLKMWSIVSTDDINYGEKGGFPKKVFRKTKVNGQLEKAFNYTTADFEYEYTKEHYLYLRLPHPLVQGTSYTLKMNKLLNADKPEVTFTYHNHHNVSEAIHLNLVGFTPESEAKTADVYLWMGDGGSRNYKGFEGKKAWIINLNTNEQVQTGNLTFRTKNRKDVFGRQLLNTNVWTVDFSSFVKPGTYKLVIEDIGSSQPFEISDDIYFNPFKVSMLGYLYMRISQDSTGLKPVPRRPLYIPGKNPENTKVYVTNLSPYSPDWHKSGRDTWDAPWFLKNYIKEGNPLNAMVKGGHSDALDWDRHLGHVSIIYDLLLPYIISNGKLDNDNLGLPESGNGIPDLIDEARYEVDFFLSMRYKRGYGHGISNPMYHNFHDYQGNIDSAWINVLFQSDNTPVAAWANAANAAMLAYAYKLAGQNMLMETYLDSAQVAYNYASQLQNKGLDMVQNVGESNMRGRDFKMTAAAYIYNITGDTLYEKVIYRESMVKDERAEIVVKNRYNQFWATVGYLFSPQKINHPKLAENMRESIIYQAEEKEASYIFKRPSRRATDDKTGYFKTIQNVQRCIVAHSLTRDYNKKKLFLKAMTFEAGWGLGRNPLNMIQMTTKTTCLENKRSIENMFTTGRDDGTPGLHPGHTPYLNLEDWSDKKIEGQPSILYKQGYPDFKKWPESEGYFNTRYMFAHSEFTPQQTMRGKTALYAYLYYLGKLSQ